MNFRGVTAAQVSDTQLISELKDGMPVLFYDPTYRDFKQRSIKVDARLNFLYVLASNVSVNVPVSALKEQEPVIRRLELIMGVTAGKKALQICREQGVAHVCLSAESAVVVHASSDAGEVTADHMLIFASSEQRLAPCIQACLDALPPPEARRQEATRIIKGYVSRQTGEKFAASNRLPPLREIVLQDTSAIFDLSVQNLELNVTFGDHASSSGSTYAAGTPANLQLGDCKSMAAKLAAGLGGGLAATEQASIALALEEVVTLRRWGTGLSPSVFRGNLARFLLDEWAVGAMVPQDSDFQGVCAEVMEGLAQSRRGPWMSGKATMQASLKAVQQRLQLETAFVEAVERCCSAGILKPPRRVASNTPWLSGVGMGPQEPPAKALLPSSIPVQVESSDQPAFASKVAKLEVLINFDDTDRMSEKLHELMENLKSAGITCSEQHVYQNVVFTDAYGRTFRLGEEPEKTPRKELFPMIMRYSPWHEAVDGKVTDMRFVESRARSWKEAAEGIIQKLDQECVRYGQLLGIDAHTGRPNDEAIFSAHFSPQLPDGGALGLCYQADETKESSWAPLYERANARMVNKEVVSMTASCSRDGSRVLYCFYYNKPRVLEQVEVVESRASSWTVASNDIIQKLYDANVKAGQVLWMDAHSNPAGGPVVFSAHFSKALPGTGPLGIKCEAYEGQYSWKEFYIQCARQVVELALHKEDVLGITYSFHEHDRCVGYLFYQDSSAIPVMSLRGQRALLLDNRGEQGSESIFEVSHDSKAEDASWFKRVLSMTLCCAGGAAVSRLAARDSSSEQPAKLSPWEHRSVVSGRWRWTGGDDSRPDALPTATAGVDSNAGRHADIPIARADLNAGRRANTPIPRADLNAGQHGQHEDMSTARADLTRNGIPDAVQQAIAPARSGPTAASGIDVPGERQVHKVATCDNLNRTGIPEVDQTFVDTRSVIATDTRNSSELHSIPISEADGFQMFVGRDTFPGSDAHSMDASNLAACKRHCRQRGFGAFVVYNNTAHFRQQSPEECRAKLSESLGSTVFVNVGNNDIPPPFHGSDEITPAGKETFDAAEHSSASRVSCILGQDTSASDGTYITGEHQNARKVTSGAVEHISPSKVTSVTGETGNVSKVSAIAEKKPRRRKLDPTLHIIEKAQQARNLDELPREACRCTHQ